MNFEFLTANQILTHDLNRWGTDDTLRLPGRVEGAAHAIAASVAAILVSLFVSIAHFVHGQHT